MAIEQRQISPLNRFGGISSNLLYIVSDDLPLVILPRDSSNLLKQVT